MEEKKWLNYWKKSLSDSLKADINIEKLKHFEIENFNIDSNVISQLEEVNKLIDFEEERINKKKGIANKNSENWEKLERIQVLISPLKLVPIPEHLVFLKDKGSKFPFWYYVLINRKGHLSKPNELFPAFLRKFLEPLADEKTEFIFSTVEKVDQATSLGKEDYKSFEEYLTYIKTVFHFAVDQSINKYETDGYSTIQNAIVLLPDEEINAAIGIIHLYEKILNKKTIPPLLTDLITIKNDTATQPLSIEELVKANFLHLGQMGFDFPISISQRKGLYTFLETESKVFAVNGPPGTGKTTLLQSIVANKIVESAVKGGAPSIILACSNNNQAVTNIIDSFSKSNTRSGPLEGRWLPEIDGYATYLPANSKTEIELKGINYKKQNGEGFFKKIEDYSYLTLAKTFFLKKASAYLDSTVLNINDINSKLQSEIIILQSTLKSATQKWGNYLSSEKLFESSYCSDAINQQSYYSSNLLNEGCFNTDISNLTKLEEKIILYFNHEPLYRKFFCFLGIKSAIQNRASEIKVLLRDTLINDLRNFVFTKPAILELIDGKIRAAKEIVKAILEWKAWKHQNSINGNPPKTEAEYWKFENLKIEGLRKGDHNLSQPNCFYDELDISLRHKAFQLALHYWEGRWLLAIEEDLNDVNFDKKKGLKAVKNRWERQAMITPCFVSTFYMAPKFFSSSKFLNKGEDGKNLYDYPPLFNFIDLLVVDEAGQVSPEVGIATFSLAKQAVIVGDVMQIEPVWNITPKIDIGNLKREALINSYEDPVLEEEFDPKGFLASTGSIMKMAQNACDYQEEELSDKASFL